MFVTRRLPRRPRHSRRLQVAFLLPALLLTALACGSGSSSPTAPGEPEQPSFSTVAVESQIYQMLDRARRNRSLPSLGLDPQLTDIARAHSRAMRDFGFFDHVDHVGNDFADRLDIAGVTYTAAAENIARNSNASDPARFAHDQLMSSPPHRANILDPRFTQIGIGVARRGSTYWVTQLFIRR